MKQLLLQKIFPLGSRRRRFVEIFYESFRIIYREGISKFLYLAMNRLRSSKLFSRSAKLDLSEKFYPLSFPAFDNVTVSIIIPVYNQAVYTFNCLRSVLEKTSDVCYEIVLIDNASGKETVEMLNAVSNIKIIRNSENKGFVAACNQGAEEASGGFLLFLNNDTQVETGWLSALLDIFKKEPAAGAAGAKLIYPNGVLQEAGGIIWADKAAWNYGKFDDPDKPEYSYVREVDYCSGACLMVRKSIFEIVGGFDTRYAPAYCEDADLCFALRQAGHKVIFQPKSRVIHFEGITSGGKVYSGLKKYQVINFEKFTDKWAEAVSQQQFMENDGKAFLARDRKQGKRILIIDHHVPTHDKDAGSFWMYSFAKGLSGMGHRVIFWPDNLHAEQPYTEDLQQIGVEVIYGLRRFDKYLNDVGRFIDVVVLTRQHIAIKYIDMVKKYLKHAKVIYRMPDLEYLREQRRARLEGRKDVLKESEEIFQREFYLFEKSDVIIAISNEEKAVLLKELPGKRIEIIPHPINKITPVNTPFENRKDLLFVGSMHPPNEDAVLYFANDIMPVLHKRLPGVKLYAVGSNPSKRLQDLKDKSIFVTGFVKDLYPYFDKCRAYIAPLRYGAGVKGKIIEAMSFGLPIVTTSTGAEGLNLTNGDNILVADSTDDFADAVAHLYNDRELWEKLSRNSLKYVEEYFSQEVFLNLIQEMINTV